MDAVNNALKPISNLLPKGAQDFLEGGGWWIVIGLVALVLLLILLAILGWIHRALFGKRPGPPAPERGVTTEHLAEYPPAPGPPGPRRVFIEGFPARLRLVVVAPLSKDARVDPDAVPLLLDQVVRGLGEIARCDKPRIRVWPVQLSSQGFPATFHRVTKKPEPEGKRTRWLLLAGRTPGAGRQPLLLGLALWADEPTMLGRLTLEPEQWRDIVRIKTPEA
jgi:hypothetical protein